MSAVYSTSFVQVQGIVTPLTTAVAAGTLHVIRDIQVYYNFPGGIEAEFRLTGDQAQTVVFWPFTITSGDRIFGWTGRQVMHESWTVSGTDLMDISVSGYILSLP